MRKLGNPWKKREEMGGCSIGVREEKSLVLDCVKVDLQKMRKLRNMKTNKKMRF